MEEREIQAKLPGIYSILQQKSLPPNSWAQLYTDFSGLLWLNPEEGQEDEVIKGIIFICDRIGKALLHDSPYCNPFDFNRVKIIINDSIYKIVTQKEKVKEICTTSKRLINEMDFFVACREKLQLALPNQVSEQFEGIEFSYKAFKKVMVNITLQLEKSIQSEYDKNFGELLDEVFYTEVLYPNKKLMKSQADTDEALESYKQKRYSSTIHYTDYFTTYSKHDDIYIGEVNEFNQKHGYGKMYYANRDLYEGMWMNDKKHGEGLYLWKDGSKYLGTFFKGKPHGLGKKLHSGGNYYEGEYLNGKKSGKGIMKFQNGDSYEGEWDDDDMHGQGNYRWASGDSYTGEFSKDKREGKGTLTLNTGEIYESVWENGSMKKEKDNELAPSQKSSKKKQKDNGTVMIWSL